VDEARDIFSRTETPVHVQRLDRRAPFAWRGNGTRIGSMFISANQYGGAAEVRSLASASAFSMAFPLAAAGGEGSDGRTRTTIARGHTAWLSSHVGLSSFRFATGYQGLRFTIPRPEMESALAALGCAPESKVLHFAMPVAIGSGPGAAVQRLLRFAADEADRDDHAFASPLVTARFVDSLLLTLLLGQPSNYSAELHAPPPAPEPRHLRMAAEYLEAHAHRPVRMADLARVVGVSARTLQLGFLKHRGCTPMEFLRDRRLMLARSRLLSRSRSTVTQIALDCGFEHLGRFSARYQARFGESPSGTQAKAR
jgi:AraC-like DNA-binding protein